MGSYASNESRRNSAESKDSKNYNGTTSNKYANKFPPNQMKPKVPSSRLLPRPNATNTKVAKRPMALKATEVKPSQPSYSKNYDEPAMETNYTLTL